MNALYNTTSKYTIFQLYRLKQLGKTMKIIPFTLCCLTFFTILPVDAQPLGSQEETGIKCLESSISIHTTPGKTTGKMPKILSAEAEFKFPVIQIPEAGSPLEPGKATGKVLRADTEEVICQRPIEIILDEDSGAWPDFKYVPAGKFGIAELGTLPVLELGELKDDMGRPIKLQVNIDGKVIEGHDLSVAAPIFAISGTHTITLTFIDFYNRSIDFHYWEWWQEAIKTALDKAFTQDQTELGVPEGCRCILRKKMVSFDTTAGKGEGDGDAMYATIGSSLSVEKIEVDDHCHDPDSHAAADASYEKHKFEIVCAKRVGGEQSSCKTCCSKPVILADIEASIGGLTAYAEDNTERAMLKVALDGSGLGKFMMQSWVASGYQNYEYQEGISLGGEMGFAAVGNALAPSP